MKQRLLEYFKSDRHLWWTVTVLPGIYSILYLYTNNYTLVNSWYQFVGFLLLFIALPIIEILLLDLAFKKWLPAHRAKLYWSYLLINFAIILSWCVFLGWRWKALILVAVITIISAFFISKHYKKIVLIIGIMTGFAIFYFVYFFVERVAISEDWTVTQSFEDLTFKKKPNIYLIQPDGFVAQKTAENSAYRWENTSFYAALESKGFQVNHDYRSNYPSTLTSNSALFTGQQHYFENGNMEGELFNARDIIMGDNATLRTLQSNGYQLNAILQHKYLLLNHPKTAYDYLNISDAELSIMPNYESNKDYQQDLYDAMNRSNEKPQFYFVEILEPGHIPTSTSGNNPIESSRNEYINGLNRMTRVLMKMVEHIKTSDPNALIIIAADHGGYVGYKSTGEATEKSTHNLELKQSLFNALLAIKAPADFEPYENNIKSSVGIFNNLFHYLAALPVPKDTIDNSSYIFIKKGDARGVYKYYNSNGEPVTQKVQL